MTIETFKEKAQTMRPMLMSTALRIVGDRTEAEDIGFIFMDKGRKKKGDVPRHFPFKS